MFKNFFMWQKYTMTNIKTNHVYVSNSNNHLDVRLSPNHTEKSSYKAITNEQLVYFLNESLELEEPYALTINDIKELERISVRNTNVPNPGESILDLIFNGLTFFDDANNDKVLTQQAIISVSKALIDWKQSPSTLSKNDHLLPLINILKLNIAQNDTFWTKALDAIESIKLKFSKLINKDAPNSHQKEMHVSDLWSTQNTTSNLKNYATLNDLEIQLPYNSTQIIDNIGGWIKQIKTHKNPANVQNFINNILLTYKKRDQQNLDTETMNKFIIGFLQALANDLNISFTNLTKEEFTLITDKIQEIVTEGMDINLIPGSFDFPTFTCLTSFFGTSAYFNVNLDNYESINKFLSDKLKIASEKHNFDFDKVLNSIKQNALKYNINPNLLLSVAFIESEFKPSAGSAANALGFFQLTPITVTEVNNYIAKNNLYAEPLTREDMFDNIKIASIYLKMLYARFDKTSANFSINIDFSNFLKSTHLSNKISYNNKNGHLTVIGQLTPQELLILKKYFPSETDKNSLDELFIKANENKLPLILAAYNAGPTVVDNYYNSKRQLPPYRETIAYISKILQYLI
jgi:hypothetical protein